jgi:hypothetical protein
MNGMDGANTSVQGSSPASNQVIVVSPTKQVSHRHHDVNSYTDPAPLFGFMCRDRTLDKALLAAYPVWQRQRRISGIHTHSVQQSYVTTLRVL